MSVAPSDRPEGPVPHLAARGRRAWRVVRERGPSGAQFWFIALLMGVASGYAAVGFMTAIRALQTFLYGTEDPRLLHSFAATLPWWWVLALPAIGGLVVGLILDRFTPDGRVRSVADVIEAAALREGRVERKAGLASMLSSLITLSSGGSSGREGPVVHITGMIAGWISNRINADGITGRELLGCAVAAGVAASFNAPIAGALFAMEVINRHFSVHAFAPITISAVAGAVVSRTHFGDVTEFALEEGGVLAFYVELPAFLLLGLLCGVVAVILMRAVFFCDDVGTAVQDRTGLPRWARPALAGLLLGAVAIAFPHIIGVGYETTSAALSGGLGLREAVVFAAVKVAAVAMTVGGRMGGGVFSPALMVGALTGLAFGILATGVFPEVSGSETLYALAGMGAVAAAVLGAPISTTLIVFELTGDWQTGLAVMVAVSMATAVGSRLMGGSFFDRQLARRGQQIGAGPQAYIPATIRVTSHMKALSHPKAPATERVEAAMAEGRWIEADATFATALPVLRESGAEFVPVVRVEDGAPRPVAVLLAVDAFRAFNRALAARAAEEHA